jgi:multidrug resistance efflux pump
MNMADETSTELLPETSEAPTANRLPATETGHLLPAHRDTKRRRRIIILLVILVLLVAGFFIWRYLSSYESTDDAQGDLHMYPVSARISGYVVKVNVGDNQWVEKGAVLVEIDPTDYEVALKQAQANLANAEAPAQSHHSSDHVRKQFEPIEFHGIRCGRRQRGSGRRRETTGCRS